MTPDERSARLEECARPIRAYLAACGLPPAQAAALARTHARDVVDRHLPLEQGLAALHDRLDDWAAPYGTTFRDESHAHRAARGRARVLLAGLPARWPSAFLSPVLPAPARAAISAIPLHATPDLRDTTSMVPQPLDLGPVSEVAEGTWRTYDKWPVLRALTIWLLFFCLLAAVLYTVRF
ncbi:MAG TPA: hypothetical protein VEB66_01265 [Opitutaceae bacterium]|nr:hypothetical protein [Opitutaceae bacterium]